MSTNDEGGITGSEALEVLTLGAGELEQILARADGVRRATFGNRVRLCAISNARSGACPERCDFCSQSARFDTGAAVFGMKKARQVADEAVLAEQAGAREFSIVTSGRSLRHEADLREVDGALELIGAETSLERCASLGEAPREVLDRLAESGLMHYHHNIETAPSFHHRVIHTHTFDDEVRVIQDARQAGLKLCCGGILGMGETREQQVEMALTLKELQPDCIPLNFLDPRPGTPLASRDALDPVECLKIIAMFRLVMPHTPIFVCGGREAALGDHQHRIFEAGASGTMIGDYLTTRGQDVGANHAMICEAGYQVETHR